MAKRRRGDGAPITSDDLYPAACVSASCQALQQEVDAALEGTISLSSLNSLACALAEAGETAALVRVWDALGGKGASPATWLAVEALHARPKHQPLLSSGLSSNCTRSAQDRATM